MKVIKTSLDGVVIIEPHVFLDSRGYFFYYCPLKLFDSTKN